MKKPKIIPGMICSVDPNNTLKKDTSSVTHVVTMKKNRRLFGRSFWYCMNANEEGDTKYINIDEKLLYPENMFLLRFSPDTPVINDNDIKAIEFAIALLKSSYDNEIGLGVTSTISLLNSKDSTMHLKRLNALKEKLEYCKNMRNV